MSEEIEITRQQQEVLRVGKNKKIVCVEAGIIVNREDLTVKEEIAVCRYISEEIHTRVIQNLRNYV